MKDRSNLKTIHIAQFKGTFRTIFLYDVSTRNEIGFKELN